MRELLEPIGRAALVDHHCHGLMRADLDRNGFEVSLTEAGAVSPFGTSPFESQVGLAVRRWCAPVLDLPPLAPAEDYLARRAELGATEVNRRMLRASGIAEYFVDGGFRADELTGTAELAELSGGAAHPVVRLEQVAEDVVRSGVSASGFTADVQAELAKQCAGAVGVKSIAAYRSGLDLAGERPTDADVRAAADRWLRAGGQLADEVLHRFLIWCGIDLGLPVQFHTGYGDADLDLHRADPSLLTNLLRATESSGVPIMLLHTYPFHRNAGYLAQVFPHVFVDVGLATHMVGHRAPAVIAELLELAPFGKALYSSDAFGLAEFYLLGATLYRHGLSAFLRNGIDDGAMTVADAERITGLISSENALRAYRLPR